MSPHLHTPPSLPSVKQQKNFMSPSILSSLSSFFTHPSPSFVPAWHAEAKSSPQQTNEIYIDIQVTKRDDLIRHLRCSFVQSHNSIRPLNVLTPSQRIRISFYFDLTKDDPISIAKDMVVRFSDRFEKFTISANDLTVMLATEIDKVICIERNAIKTSTLIDNSHDIGPQD